jgi:hypothetical protein
MPSTIPYDPSLVLANVINEKALKYIEDISANQSPIDGAHDQLVALLSSRRSFEATKIELANLEIETKEVDEKIQELNENIKTSATSYATTKIKNEEEIRRLRGELRSEHSQVESPVDFIKTTIKTMPLAADSMNMDVQYFSMDSYNQDEKAFAAAISAYVSTKTSLLGQDTSKKAGASGYDQTAAQASMHKLAGTLVLSCTCTHKNVAVLAPFVLNVDKAIEVWNHLFQDDALKPTEPSNMMEEAAGSNLVAEKKFSIISGASFGSSFVGMVHIMNTTTTEVKQSMSSFATSLQAQMDAGNWFSSAAGGLGVDATFGDQVKALLSSQNISSHVTLICMGVIPSLVSSNVQLAVEKFANFNPKSSMEAIATLANANVSSQESLKSASEGARTGGQMMAMKANEIKATMEALEKVDDGQNKVLDINSMMTAFEDYLKKAAEGTSGVPINYYLKDISKAMLAKMWVAKYMPGKYMSFELDDSKAQPNQNGSGTTSAGNP